MENSLAQSGFFVKILYTYLLPGEDPSYQTHSTSGELTGLTVYIYTLNEDGSVSFEVYVPRAVSVYLQ